MKLSLPAFVYALLVVLGAFQGLLWSVLVVLIFPLAFPLLFAGPLGYAALVTALALVIDVSATTRAA